ncbi:MAG: Ig domain-containing protein, partial [Rhodospirillaceae bacterium]
LYGGQGGPAGDAEPIWVYNNPNQFYFLPPSGGLVIKKYDITNDTVTTVANFAGRLPWPSAGHCWTKSEGSPSADQRYWAFQCSNDSFSTFLGVFTYDMQTDSIIATLSMSDGPDYVTMSPSGEYVVLGWNDATIFQDGKEERVRAYYRDFSDWTWAGCLAQHSDWALGVNGNDYYMSVDHSSGGGGFACSPANGQIFTSDVQTGFVSEGKSTQRDDHFGTYLDGGAIAGGAHFSGKAFDNPGRFIWSSYACYGTNACAHAWADSILMGNVASPASMVKVASINTIWASYNTEPHASISRDGTKVAFNSTWGNSGDNALDVYVLDLPTDFSITTTTLPNGTNGQAYQADAQTSGGVQPPTACITSAGAVPTGATWSVSGTACRLSDASAETGTYNFTLQATDSDSNTDTQAFTLTVTATLTIDTTTLSDGTQGSGYSQALSISGGTPPYTCTVQSGSLPSGASLGGTGNCTITASELTGTGEASFTIRVTDDVAATDDQALTLTVSGGASLTMFSPDIRPLSTSVMVRLGAQGLPYENDCTATLKDEGGATVDTATSAAGYARRTLTFTGLTAATAYSLTMVCVGATPDLTPYPFTTLAAASGGDRTVPIVFGDSHLTAAARVTVEYDDNEALSSSATVQNASCGSGCTVNLIIPAGLYWYRHKWQDGSDNVLATSKIQPLLVE